MRQTNKEITESISEVILVAGLYQKGVEVVEEYFRMHYTPRQQENNPWRTKAAEALAEKISGFIKEFQSDVQKAESLDELETFLK